MSGWFSAQHGISDHPLFRKRPDRLAIWIWLLDHAAYKPMPFNLSGKIVMLERGQVAVSQRRLAEHFAVGRQVVRSALDLFESHKMLTPSPTHNGSVVSICNYEKYQSSQPSANPVKNPVLTQQQPTKEQVNNIPVGTGDKSPPADPAKIVFDSGVKLLSGSGVSDRQARTMIGRWRKNYDDAEIISAISACERIGAVDPVGYISGCLRKRRVEPRPGDTRTTSAGQRQVFMSNVDGWVESR